MHSVEHMLRRPNRRKIQAYTICSVSESTLGHSHNFYLSYDFSTIYQCQVIQPIYTAYHLSILLTCIYDMHL